MNQLYLTVERLAKIENNRGFDYGYRADLMFVTDRRYVKTYSGHGVGQRLGQWQPLLWSGPAAMSGDLASDKLLLRGGHFYVVGLRNANAHGNFFYSTPTSSGY